MKFVNGLVVNEANVLHQLAHLCGKPIRFGYKVLCMCTPEGYLIQAEPYQGANTGDNIEGLGMGGSVVANLTSELPHSNFSLFFDNLFTSLPLWII